MRPRWAEREPDEPAEDWLLRLVIGRMAEAGLRIPVRETERTAS
jgi:hypothetical protein